MELDDESVRKIKFHLMAVADLLGGVPVPRGSKPAPKTDRRVVPLPTILRAVELQPGVFTCRMLHTSLTAAGVNVKLSAVTRRLQQISQDGLVIKLERGTYQRKG